MGGRVLGDAPPPDAPRNVLAVFIGEAGTGGDVCAGCMGDCGDGDGDARGTRQAGLG